MEKYDGIGQPREHIDKCITQWRLVPPEEWPHHFIHTLEGIPRNWYTKLELHRGTVNWKDLQQNFVITFAFEHENPEIDTTLKLIKERIFEEPEVEIVTTYHNQNRQTVRQLLHCYHIAEDDPTEENPCDIQITEVEGEREVEGPKLESE
jgi:hypothetical protein